MAIIFGAMSIPVASAPRLGRSSGEVARPGADVEDPGAGADARGVEHALPPCWW